MEQSDCDSDTELNREHDNARANACLVRVCVRLHLLEIIISRIASGQCRGGGACAAWYPVKHSKHSGMRCAVERAHAYCQVLLLFSFYTSTDSGIKPTTARLYLCCGSMIKIHQVLNYAEYVDLDLYLFILILDVLNAQSGSWTAVSVKCVSAVLIIRCFTCSHWNRSSESCLSYQLETQERFHTADPHAWWASQSVQSSLYLATRRRDSPRLSGSGLEGESGGLGLVG
jgi:hypothetical protein